LPFSPGPGNGPGRVGTCKRESDGHSAAVIRRDVVDGRHDERSSTAEEDENLSPVQQDFQISPIPKSRLNLTGKDYAAVGWGSYIVNGLSDRIHSRSSGRS
jgi:hypothetical protein